MGVTSSMDKTVHKAVRQVMFNELGLTKESLREDMRDLVYQTLHERVNKMLQSEEFTRMVADQIAHAMNAYAYYGKKTELVDLVKNAVKEAQEEFKKAVRAEVKDFLKDHTRITISLIDLAQE